MDQDEADGIQQIGSFVQIPTVEQFPSGDVQRAIFTSALDEHTPRYTSGGELSTVPRAASVYGITMALP